MSKTREKINKNKKLCEIVAIDSNVRTRVGDFETTLHKTTKKPNLFNGLIKVYQPLDEEDSVKLPPEQTLVQVRADEAIKQWAEEVSVLYDVTFTKDAGNSTALGEIIVDGETIISDVPVPTLIFLEKQLDNFHKFVASFPTLDGAYDWTFDNNENLWKADGGKTIRTEKKYKSHVLHEGNENHPPQAQLVTEDQPVGTWTTTKLSGAIHGSKQREILAQITKLSRAVKEARERANTTEVEQKEIGAALFEFLLQPLKEGVQP